MRIEVKGNSGCSVNIVEQDNKLTVHKSTTDHNYIERLMCQANKQVHSTLVPNIEVPKIHRIESTNDSATIVMDYIHAKNFVDFIEQSPISAINDFIESIISFVSKELELSHNEIIKSEVFTNKIRNIISNSQDNNYVTNYTCDLLHNSLLVFDGKDIELPIGICHGDLTLSNILFSNNKYYLIDFLDSFIETPIQDIVKIRQDTSLFWSLQMYNKQYDHIRIETAFNYIDNSIDSYFSSTCDKYTLAYPYMQLINVLRIVPYAKSSSVVNYLNDKISYLLGNLE